MRIFKELSLLSYIRFSSPVFLSINFEGEYHTSVPLVVFFFICASFSLLHRTFDKKTTIISPFKIDMPKLKFQRINEKMVLS